MVDRDKGKEKERLTKGREMGRGKEKLNECGKEGWRSRFQRK